MEGSRYIGVYQPVKSSKSEKPVARQVQPAQRTIQSSQTAKEIWNAVQASILKKEIFISLSQLNDWKVENIQLMNQAAVFDKKLAFLIEVNIERCFSERIRRLKQGLCFLTDPLTTMETLTAADYKIEHWKVRQDELRTLYNDRDCSIETRCWAKLIRAQLLHEYNRIGMPLLRDINQGDEKTKKLSFELMAIIPQMPFALRSEARALLSGVAMLIGENEFRQRVLTVSQYTLYRIFDFFQQNNYAKVVDEVERYLRHDTKHAERNYRHWARYIRVVARYHLYQPEPENDLKRTAFLKACSDFLFHYQNRKISFTNQTAFLGYACAYYAKYVENNNVVEIAQNNSLIAQTNIIDWHFDFETAFNELLQCDIWHPGLTEDEITQVNSKKVFEQLNEDLATRLSEFLNMSSESSDSNRARSRTNSSHRSRTSTASSVEISGRTSSLGLESSSSRYFQSKKEDQVDQCEGEKGISLVARQKKW